MRKFIGRHRNRWHCGRNRYGFDLLLFLFCTWSGCWCGLESILKQFQSKIVQFNRKLANSMKNWKCALKIFKLHGKIWIPLLEKIAGRLENRYKSLLLCDDQEVYCLFCHKLVIRFPHTAISAADCLLSPICVRKLHRTKYELELLLDVFLMKITRVKLLDVQ